MLCYPYNEWAEQWPWEQYDLLCLNQSPKLREVQHKVIFTLSTMSLDLQMIRCCDRTKKTNRLCNFLFVSNYMFSIFPYPFYQITLHLFNWGLYPKRLRISAFKVFIFHLGHLSKATYKKYICQKKEKQYNAFSTVRMFKEPSAKH